MTTWKSAPGCTPSTPNAAPRSAGAGSTSHRRRAQLEIALVNLAMAQAAAAGLIAGDRAGTRQARSDGRHRLSRDALGRGVPPGYTDDLVPGWHRVRSLSPAITPTRSSTRSLPPPLRRRLVMFPAGSRLVREGHPRHHPGALVSTRSRCSPTPRRRPPRMSINSYWRGNGNSSTSWNWPTGWFDIAAGDLGYERGPQVRHRSLVPVCRARTAS